MKARTVLVPAVLAAMGGVVPGCLVTSQSRTEYSGRYVGPETFERVQEGKSSQEFVRATLGEPTCRTPLSDGTEVWKWEYQKTHSGSGTVFLLFGGSDRTEHPGAAYVTFKDGVVARKWRD
jgi:outer membrane protein assembly factor BamE (lipoprotein component of BamABCDE complex)